SAINQRMFGFAGSAARKGETARPASVTTASAGRRHEGNRGIMLPPQNQGEPDGRVPYSRRYTRHVRHTPSPILRPSRGDKLPACRFASPDKLAACRYGAAPFCCHRWHPPPISATLTGTHSLPFFVEVVP